MVDEESLDHKRVRENSEEEYVGEMGSEFVERKVLTLSKLMRRGKKAWVGLIKVRVLKRPFKCIGKFITQLLFNACLRVGCPYSVEKG